MIAEVMATEFPEFVFAFAEENFLRGYQLGLDDAYRTYSKRNNADERKQTDFYTPSGLHVYFKDKLENPDINVQDVISQLKKQFLNIFIRRRNDNCWLV